MRLLYIITISSTLSCTEPKTPARHDSGRGLGDSDSASLDTGNSPPLPDTGQGETGQPDTGIDTGEPAPEPITPDWPEGLDPFADAVVEFVPGPDAGFGADHFPDVVLGPPEGGSGGAGSTHVLTLGELGSILLEMTDLEIIDGPGPDLIVFENPFPAWRETGRVEASLDGVDWYAWPCFPEDVEGDFPGCAGKASVYASSDFLVDPTDPESAGGDAFDLADLGLPAARYIRVTDSGHNAFGYGGTTGGFDLDAIAAANWREIRDD